MIGRSAVWSIQQVRRVSRGCSRSRMVPVAGRFKIVARTHHRGRNRLKMVL